MISFVAEVFNLLAFIVHKVFILASFIGKLIVATVTESTNTVYKVFENLVLFLQIIYEDNVPLLSEEIPNFIYDAADTFGNQINYMLTSVGTLCYGVFQSSSSAINTANNIANSILVVTRDVLFLLKNAIIFIGNTIWLILTFFPVHLPQFLQIGFKYVSSFLVNSIVDAYMLLLKFTNFMSDVPLESFIGITSAIIITRLCVHFRGTIVSYIVEAYWSLVRKLLYFYHMLYNYLTDSEVRVITHMASGQDIASLTPSVSAGESDDGIGADALCIICQERQKCVLTLPCRHVCLCAECCRRLYGYQRTCPICRTFIYHSVTVYL